MLSRFWLTVLSVDMAALAAVVILLRNTLAHQFGCGNKVVEVPRLLAVIVLWLAVGVPLTAALLFARRIMRR